MNRESEGEWYPTSREKRAKVVPAERELQIPRLPPDFLSGFVVSVNLMRLSLEKAAYVVVFESSVVGNPEFAPNDTGASRPRFSGAPTALRSFSGLSPSPSGLGSRFGGRPSPGFPVELGGFDELHAPFFMERRKRGSLQCSVAGNPGPGLTSMAILQCHFFLNLPEASWLLGMTKGRAVLTLTAVTEGWTEPQLKYLRRRR
jgi:hypothetical protein